MRERRKPSRGKRKECISKNKLTYGIIAVAVILVCVFAFSSFFFNKPSSDDQTAPPKAALIDHLSFLTPNQTFKTRCMNILSGAGFNVTYYKGEKVTVSFYKYLPTYGYKLMVLRVHSAVIEDAEGNRTNLIGLFTSEIFDETTESMYRDDLESGKLALARLLMYGTNDTYFGITPFFVKEEMRGDFEDTVIIMMGCEGLTHDSMADALVHLREAKVYMSWTGLVSISHTDQSTIRLLRSLLQENRTIRDAVREVSPDPTWSWSRLNYYPSKGSEDVGNYRIQHFISGLATKAYETSMISVELWRPRVKSILKPSRTKKCPS